MKYIPLLATDIVSHALNFSTPDCHIVGSCDIYAVKASKADQKLYKKIDEKLEAQHETLVRLSESMSPPSEDAKGGEENGGGRRGSTQETTDIDLSRTTPFGSFHQHSARRTFAYFIATLNASHEDYEFFYTVSPRNFRKETSILSVMNDIDSTMQQLRPRQTATVLRMSPPMYSTSAPSMSGIANEVWNTNMWRLLDREMNLLQCEKYFFTPDWNPFSNEVGSIWSKHYFFYNKDKKRVCYIHFRAYSVISHSPTYALKPLSHPNKKKNGGFSPDPCNDEDMFGPDDDELDVSHMDLDDLRDEMMAGRGDYTYDDDDGDDDEYDNSSWQSSPHVPRVRGMSEEIGATMEMGS